MCNRATYIYSSLGRSVKAPFSIILRLLMFCTELQEQKWGKISVITILLSETVNKQTNPSKTSHSERQELKALLCNWQTNPVKLKWNAKHIPAVQMNNCFHRVWMWRVVEGVCHLHFSQAVEGEESMSLYLCDAVALRNLTVPQRNGATSINRLTRQGE